MGHHERGGLNYIWNNITRLSSLNFVHSLCCNWKRYRGLYTSLLLVMVGASTCSGLTSGTLCCMCCTGTWRLLRTACCCLCWTGSCRWICPCRLFGTGCCWFIGIALFLKPYGSRPRPWGWTLLPRPLGMLIKLKFENKIKLLIICIQWYLVSKLL